jgi:hypothetical protein
VSVQRVERSEVVGRALEVLGLEDSAVDLFSIEGLCASLRRAASLLCPASPQQIVDAVVEALAPLGAEVERDEVAEALDSLVSLGDLLELRQSGSRTRELFLGPPSYIEKHPGEYLLVGVRARAARLFDEESLGVEIYYEAHTRTLVLPPDAATAMLTSAGLHRLTREQWAKAPRHQSPSDVIERVQDRLSAERRSGVVTGLTVIDGTASNRFYKGRWRDPRPADSGLFVGRRPQAYGASIWCAVELEAGVPQAVLDLPTESLVNPGWDEARHVQAALDAERGMAQFYEIRASGQPEQFVFDFFAPLPSWAERYLALVGIPVVKTKGSLFTYRLPEAAVEDVKAFLFASLWMDAIEEDHRP